MDADTVEKVIDRWMRGEYYRDVLIICSGSSIERYLVLNKQVFKRLYNRYGRSMNNCGFYASVYSLRQQQQSRYDTILLDIDVHIEDKPIPYIVAEAHKQLRTVLAILKKKGIEEYRIYFTGRGYHIYIDFPEEQIYGFNRVAREFVKWLGVHRYVDMKVVGDKRRVARVPYTVNQHVGLMVIPVHEKMTVKQILRYARRGAVDIEIENWYPRNTWIANKLHEIEENLGCKEERQIEKEKEPSERYPYFSKHRSFEELPRCIQNAVKQLIVVGELDHYQRLYMAQCLLRIWGYRDTVAVFKLAKDYKPWKTLYQLDYIVETQQVPYKCKRVKEELGLCPYEQQRKCPFYPWLEIWMPRWTDVIDKIHEERERVYEEEYNG